SHCLNSGSVSGTGDYVGGVCGNNNNNSTISHCLNSGSVSGTNDLVGGVCGYNVNSSINHCLNSGSVSNSGTGSNVGGVCGNSSTNTIINCYYDKQLCGFGGIGGSDVAGQAEGKLTTEMTGTALQTVLGTDNWTFVDGIYPRVKNGTENSDAAIVAATPIFLAATDTITFETVNRVGANFTYSGTDSVVWSSSQSRISFSNGTATLVSAGTDTITAIYGNAVKQIAITTVMGGSAF
ncbi:MAG: hypothetical protein PHR53_07575, partial [Bacteroidales bacterium]|nr:hypothetical protein [Bacteroidales bacterium]